MKASVIVSTYNNVAFLEKTLWGLCCQTWQDFEVLIADDGSTTETRDLVDRFRDASPLAVVHHLWQENRGYRKGKIFNQAIARAAGDYLIFLDGDCIPRDDFVAAHCRLARPNSYIAGGSHIDVPTAMHSRICRAAVENQWVFEPAWLASRGMAASRYRYRLTRNRFLARLLDTISPRPGVLVGANASAWKRDVLAVNGFDATFTHGCDDKELGVRLTNHGLKSRRLKYSLVCVHLSHPRPYTSPQQKAENKRRLQQLRARRVTWTPHGICGASEPCPCEDSPPPRTTSELVPALGTVLG